MTCDGFNKTIRHKFIINAQIKKCSNVRRKNVTTNITQSDYVNARVQIEMHFEFIKHICVEFQSCQLQFDSSIINTLSIFFSFILVPINRLQYSLFNNNNMNNNHFIAINVPIAPYINLIKMSALLQNSRAFQFNFFLLSRYYCYYPIFSVTV